MLRNFAEAVGELAHCSGKNPQTGLVIAASAMPL
jgi:hypothetical protein